MNEIHDQLYGHIAEADSLRAEAERLRGQIRAESARRGQLRADLSIERQEAAGCRAAFRSQLEAEFRGYHGRMLAALASLPPLDAVAELDALELAEGDQRGGSSGAGPMEAIRQKLIEAESVFGVEDSSETQTGPLGTVDQFMLEGGAGRTVDQFLGAGAAGPPQGEK